MGRREALEDRIAGLNKSIAHLREVVRLDPSSAAAARAKIADAEQLLAEAKRHLKRLDDEEA